MLTEKTKNEKIEYMEVYLCDDYNRGWILIPIENKKEVIWFSSIYYSSLKVSGMAIHGWSTAHISLGGVLSTTIPDR